MSNGSLLYSKSTINCGGKLLDLTEPVVMGILNVTPDSFYDGGQFNTEKDWLTHTEKMINEGAAIIDIGVVSTRPGAIGISEEEEKEKILKTLKSIRKSFPNIIISVDTWHSAVAEAAIENGAHIINDISGGTLDQKMFETIARLNVPYILMHIQGAPQNMQQNPTYKDVVKEIMLFLAERVNQLKLSGVSDIIIDPGFGFGKTVEQNYDILNNLDTFQFFELPILVGFSRKSMINKVLNIKPADALNGTTVLNTIALMNGAKILRVHDVKEAVETIKIVKKIDM